MPSGTFHYYLVTKLNADATSGTRQLHCYVVKFRFTSLCGNWQIDLDLCLTGSRVPGYILPPFEKTSSQCFKINTYQLKSNHQTYNYTNAHTFYTIIQQVIFHIWQMLLGSVEERGYQHTRLTIWTVFPLNRLYTKLAKQQTVWIHLSNLTCSFCFQCKSLHVVFASSVRVNNPWPNAMFFQFPNVLHYHVLCWKSIQSSAIDYFKSHLLAQHSMNEGESATNLEWYSI